MSDKNLEIAVQCWCDETTGHVEMDVALAEVFTKRLDDKDAIIEQLQKDVEEKDAALLLMEKGKYGLNYYAGEVTRLAGEERKLKAKNEQLQKDKAELVDGLRDVAGFLLCDGQDVEAVFNPSKKEVTEQINIIRGLIKSIGED